MFLRDLLRYRRAKTPHKIPIASLYPIYRDRFGQAGAQGHYFHQDLWAARKIFAARPVRHVDVGSRIDGFVAHCLTFMDVEVVDIRPMQDTPRGMIFRLADAEHMTGFEDNSVPSLSSLNVAEHFGLGRYGDKIDPDAHVTFIKSLQRVLSPGGKLYFSVPVSGHERVEFNAHRVLNPTTIVKAFEELKLISFSCVNDEGYLYEDVQLSEATKQRAGTGLFEFAKVA